MRDDVSPVRSLKSAPPCPREALGPEPRHSTSALRPKIVFMIWIRSQPGALRNTWYWVNLRTLYLAFRARRAESESPSSSVARQT